MVKSRVFVWLVVFVFCFVFFFFLELECLVLNPSSATCWLYNLGQSIEPCDICKLGIIIPVSFSFLRIRGVRIYKKLLKVPGA